MSVPRIKVKRLEDGKILVVSGKLQKRLLDMGFELVDADIQKSPATKGKKKSD